MTHHGNTDRYYSCDMLTVSDIKNIYKKKYGDQYKCMLVGKDWVEPIVWYCKPLKLALPVRCLFDETMRKNHDMVIDYLINHIQILVDYIENKINYFDVLNFAEKEKIK